MATTAAAPPAAPPFRDGTQPGPQPRGRSWSGLVARVGWWLGPGLVLAGFGGMLLARRHGLWYDEMYTAEVAPLPLGDLARAVVRGEGTIPYLRDAPPSYNAPYYLVAHLWLAVTGLAPDEIGLRLLSLLSATGGLVTATLAAGRLAGRQVALVSGLVLAANPFVVEYAVEARGYGLALLGAGLLALAFARWLDDRPRALLFVALAAAALGLAHWFGLLVVAAAGVAALGLRGRRALKVVSALAAGSVPALALIATAVANGVGGSGAEWIADVGGAVPRLLLRSWAGGSGWLIVLTVVLAGAGLVLGRGRSRAVAAAWVGVPVAVVTVVELFRPVYVDRYLLPALLGLALLIGIGATALRPRALALAAVVAVVASSGVASIDALRLGPKEDVRSAVEAVAARHAPGQPVVAAARWDALGLDHNARAHHRSLVPDLVLPPAPVPMGSPVVWVVRRAEGGVKGDRTKQADLDRQMDERGLHLAEELRFPGRYAATLAQRWVAP